MVEMQDRDTALTAAIMKLGSAKKLARALKVSPQALSQWRRVPPLRVLAVEEISGVSRFDLRPDLYPSDPRAGC